MSPIGVPMATSDNGDSLPYHKTFRYTGTEQSFTVPAGVKWLTVVALGTSGGGSLGGRGGRVFAEIPIHHGERLGVLVGGTTEDESSGFNGGGKGVYGTDISYGGGGATDIRQGGNRLRYRVLVVGGGGGQGGFDNNSGSGGKGGGSPAGRGHRGYGTACEMGGGRRGGGGGSGGTYKHGGSGGSGGCGGYQRGYPGLSGSLAQGGSGGQGTGENGGGGGGGGYYGGGGGGGGGWDYGDEIGGGGGGGGGSSYVEPNARRYVSWRGWKTATGNGIVVFGWQ